MNRSLKAMFVTTTLAAGAVALSPSAHAVGTHNITMTCTTDITIYGEVGDTFVFAWGNSCSASTPPWEMWNVSRPDAYPGGLLRLVSRTHADARYSSLPTANPVLDWYVGTDNSGLTTATTTLMATANHYGRVDLSVGQQVAQIDDLVRTTFLIIYGGTVAPVLPSGPGSTPEPPAGPDPILQAVEMPASGSCTSVDSSTHNWAGVSNGGWHPSWHQWANSGRGGEVCQRTLAYANGAWSVV